MERVTRGLGKTLLIAALTLVLGCTGPTTPALVTLTLSVSQPSLVGPGNARLLLGTAQQVAVTVRENEVVIASQVVPLGGSQASVSFSLAPAHRYRLEARASDASGVLRFAGASTFDLLEDQTSTLNLLPVDASGRSDTWPVLKPTMETQPPGGSVQGITIKTGQSTSFYVDLSTTANAFQLALPVGDLKAFVQRGDTGAPVTVPPSRNLSRSDVGFGFWLTYYAPTADKTQPSLGRFSIPVREFWLGGPSALAFRSTATLFIGGVKPTNSTEASVADYTWESSSPSVATVEVGPTSVTVRTFAGAGVVVVTARAKSDSSVANRLTLSVSESGLTDLVGSRSPRP